MNGADALITTLADNGVTACFANPGTSEMQFVSALDREPRMRSVLCLFEGVATGAADGYGRMAGKPACTLLHLGPGYANGAANLHNAQADDIHRAATHSLLQRSATRWVWRRVGKQPQQGEGQHADRQVQAQRQHIAAALAPQVVPSQRAGPGQQQLEAAPQRPFGRDVGPAELLHELHHRRRTYARLLATLGAERGRRDRQRVTAVRAVRRDGVRVDAGGAQGGRRIQAADVSAARGPGAHVDRPREAGCARGRKKSPMRASGFNGTCEA